jgi:hypothetical protein
MRNMRATAPLRCIAESFALASTGPTAGSAFSVSIQELSEFILNRIMAYFSPAHVKMNS